MSDPFSRCYEAFVGHKHIKRWEFKAQIYTHCALVVRLFRGGLVIQTNFSYFCTHPRHYPENGLRLLEEGDRVEGSSGFPGTVCLHPLHDPPPVCTASSLWSSFSSPLLIQRHRVCGAPGDRHRVCYSHCAPPTTAAAAAAEGPGARLFLALFLLLFLT